MMRVAFRTDASLQIGTGHVMRCLTLANALRERGAQCTFLSRAHPGNLFDLIRQSGHALQVLPLGQPAGPGTGQTAHADWLGTDWATDAQHTQQALQPPTFDWLVVDHYALDQAWERALRPHARQLMVIDDLADRPHDCHLLLDQNLGRTAQHYERWLNPAAQTLIGPHYAMLRPEFAQWREASLARRAQPQLQRLLITLGGVDQANVTEQVLAALKTCPLPTDLHITVVMGTHAPWRAQVQAQAAAMPRLTQVLVGVSNMAQLMAESDLAIGAAGSTSWERCCLGLPSIQTVVAANQGAIAAALTRAGAATEVSPTTLSTTLCEQLSAFAKGHTLRAMASAAAQVCDGTGAGMVANQMWTTHENHAALH